MYAKEKIVLKSKNSYIIVKYSETNKNVRKLVSWSSFIHQDIIITIGQGMGVNIKCFNAKFYLENYISIKNWISHIEKYRIYIV